jgi:hypothetical protein
MVAGERRRPAASSTAEAVMETSSNGQQIRALPYQADADRATVLLSEAGVSQSRGRRLETIEPRPRREP